jgi:hypothetical protein
MMNFKEEGRRAYQDGEPCAPGLNGNVLHAIAGMPVGTGAVRIMEEFTEGWREAEREATVLRLHVVNSETGEEGWIEYDPTERASQVCRNTLAQALKDEGRRRGRR